jgi:hypothetical protein
MTAFGGSGKGTTAVGHRIGFGEVKIIGQPFGHTEVSTEACRDKGVLLVAQEIGPRQTKLGLDNLLNSS